jgi:AGZA family xanthine/uracil permease-like MFS transporter
MSSLEQFFGIRRQGSTVSREIIGGITTFATMSYIIFVQPTILRTAGMDFGAVMVATCLSSGVTTIAMALIARYPIALAPGMGENFYFAFMVCGGAAMGGLGYSWQVALGGVFIAGLLFFILSFFGVREKVMEVFPQSLKSGIAAGIGLLIALVGLWYAGLVVPAPGALIRLGRLSEPPVVLALFGFAVTAILLARKISGAILCGIIVTFIVGIASGIVKYHGIAGKPASMTATFLALDLKQVFSSVNMIPVVFVFLFLDLFDTVGTLIGVGEQGGFMVNGKLPRARQAFLCDAFGTMLGASMGTSTVTSYVESAAGVSAGARTGFASIVTGLLFLVAPFFGKLAQSVGDGIPLSTGTMAYPVVAPALIIVGSMMMRSAVDVNWKDPTESVPGFLTIVMMGFTLSITEGIGFGLISYCLLKLAAGKAKEVHWSMYLIAALLLGRYIFLVK